MRPKEVNLLNDDVALGFLVIGGMIMALWVGAAGVWLFNLLTDIGAF